MATLPQLWRRLRRVKHPMVVILIGLNALIFLYQSVIPSGEFLAVRFGAIPAWITEAWHLMLVPNAPKPYATLATLFTATFLHADAEHLGMNMLLLWIFGCIDEELMGWFLMLLAYVFTGIAGNIAQTYYVPTSEGPIIGASGAISGLEGVYLMLALRWNPPWPHVWPMSRPIPPLNLAIVGVLGFYLDSISLYGSDQHIAYGAHLGGFVAGITFGMFLTTFLRPK